MIELLQEELKAKPGERRAVRLHHELATLYEYHLDDMAKAAEQYQAALGVVPEHLPSIRGARRTLLELGRPRDVLPLFDAEVRLTGDPHRRASLLLEKGAVYEHELNLLKEAREAYQAASELDGQNVSILKALERCDRRRESWQELSSTYERLANVVDDDESFRAALIANRALLSEVRQHDPEGASSLYQAALSLDPRAPSALPSLKRLHHAAGRWSELVVVLRHELDHTTTSDAKVVALQRIARLNASELGDTSEAIAALEAAAAEVPGSVTVLRDLVDLYTKAKRSEPLASALERLFMITTDAGERLMVAHRLGQLLEGVLRDDEGARRWYEEALGVDASFRPALDALANLYERTGNWDGLIQMHLREIAERRDELSKAVAHVRIAQVLETQLGRPDEAAEHFDKALGFAPDHEIAFKSLAKLHAEAGRWRDLAELYQRVVDRSPGEERAVAYLFKIGALYEDHLGDPAGALHAYRRILENAPDHLGAIQAAQQAAERAGDHEVLLQMLDREVKLERRPKTKSALQCRAAEVCERYLGDVDGAIQRLRRVLKADAKHEVALKLLSRILRRAGRWEDLLQNYQVELANESDTTVRARLVHKMGELCETRLGREKEAIAYYKQALGIDPDHSRDSFEALVRLMSSREDVTELAKMMEERLEQLDDDAEAADLAVAAAVLYEERLDNPAQALSSYERALEAIPGYQPALDGRTRLLHGAGKWKRLADDLAAEADNSHEETRALDAKVEEGLVRAHRLGDRAAAAACFEWVLERCPDHCGALMALEELHLMSGDAQALADVYRRQADMLTNRGARVAVLKELARLKEEAELLDEAADAYQRVLELVGDDADTLESVARLSVARGVDDEAIQALSQLVNVIEDSSAGAGHMARLAERIESRGEADVLGAYRAALALDPDSLLIARGFTRAARRSGDPAALREAALREATVTRHLPTAVALLQESAKLRLKDNDLEGAGVDLEKALELDPGHKVVAEALEAVLIRLDQVERLIEQLSRASDVVSDTERKAELQLTTASLYADHLHKLPAAIAAAKRALAAKPDHLGAHVRLARALEDAERWQEAVDALGKVVELAKDSEVIVDAHLRLAAIVDDLLNEPERAMPSLRVVLSKAPANREALFRISRLEANKGRYDSALSHAEKLLEDAANATERAEVLLHIAFIERKRKNHEAVRKALGEAVAVAGVEGLAARSYQQMIESQVGGATWDAFLAAITKHIDLASSAGNPVGPAFRAAAVVLGDHLGRPKDAIKSLRRALDREPESVRTRLHLARLQRQLANHSQAVDELRELFDRDAAMADAWREYALVEQARGNAREAAAATQALKVLGAATPEELMTVMGYQPRIVQPPEGFLESTGIGAILTNPSMRPITDLVAALAPAFTKLYPMDPGRYGLGKRDRIPLASASPLRAVADEVVRYVDAAGFDLYFHQKTTSDVSVELGKPPALFIPEWAGGLSKSALVFLLTRPLLNIARDVHIVYRVSTQELALLLAGAARQVLPTFRSGVGIEAEIEERARAVARAIPRRSRKAVTAAAERYAERPGDLKQWVKEVHRSAARTALLLSDDLVSAIDLIQKVSGETVQREGTATDLLRFWVSETALRYRGARA